MTGVCKELFKAIHEGKWLSIEYRNKDDQITKYWIGIKGLTPAKGILLVDGLHLGTLETQELHIYADSILSAVVVEGTYFPVNATLLNDISAQPEKYACFFQNTANLRVLNYLAECNRLDATPYQCDYVLMKQFDEDCLIGGSYALTEEQFRVIVDHFQYKSRKDDVKVRVKQLCVNVLSVPTRKGLYVLAYRKLELDVEARRLRGVEQITVCKEFTIAGEQKSIRQFLDADDYDLLDHFEENLERIKDRITDCNPQITGVDDRPYLMAIGMDHILDLNQEYAGIMNMYHENRVTAPIQAFFGDIVKLPVRRKNYPPALLNRRVNLDQFLAIHNAVKYPLTYVQGPPGTGKTNTIVNTVSTAFFNGKTILFASYNNHPIDGVFNTLSHLTYRGKKIPFPIVRLGNNLKVSDAIRYIRELYEQTKNITIYESTLERKKDVKVEQTQTLTALLERYEKILDLRKRKETLEQMLLDCTKGRMDIQFELTSQLGTLNEELDKCGIVTTEEALSLLTNDEEEFYKYLYYTSARFIKRIGEPKNKDLLDILYMNDEEEQLSQFNRYLAEDENLKKFIRIFPIIATTCISAHKLGEPRPYFDMVIMDEASQCNTAVSLVPILRGENLMLVGDPQQLSPVILLDGKDNDFLKEKYAVSPAYDYIDHSVYKTYLACDSVSDEILLSYHYRCHPKIITFNNKKYYNQKLHIESTVQSACPLLYVDVPNDSGAEKNTAPAEAFHILDYANKNKDKKIGVITPFVNQKNLIDQLLRENGLSHVTCGTVHAFQGDEKDVILFSMAVTAQTHLKTYQWLKGNKELINVATSRAREQLIVLSNKKALERLHQSDADDDIFELVEYVQSNGLSQVTEKSPQSRALGIKPYSTQTESAFMESLNHALGNIDRSMHKYSIHKEVSISQVFADNPSYNSLFYTGRFDFVVYERHGKGKELPVFAIELDGKEHFTDAVVRQRDQKKAAICREHGFDLIRIENTYARRYHYIKEILTQYFAKT